MEREDIHQIITYMYILKAKHGGLVCPINDYTEQQQKTYFLNGYEGKLCIYGLPIDSKANDYATFCEKMKHAEGILRKSIEINMV